MTISSTSGVGRDAWVKNRNVPFFRSRSRRSAPSGRTALAAEKSNCSLIRVFRKVQPAASRALISKSEEHTSELQSLMRISYAVFCLKKKNKNHNIHTEIKKI